MTWITRAINVVIGSCGPIYFWRSLRPLGFKIRKAIHAVAITSIKLLCEASSNIYKPMQKSCCVEAAQRFISLINRTRNFYFGKHLIVLVPENVQCPWISIVCSIWVAVRFEREHDQMLAEV